MNSPIARFGSAAALAVIAQVSVAAPAFVNGLTIAGSSLDASGGSLVNDGRLGFFSDIYYDAVRNEWWALSDRGPGGGTLSYDTRVHRFTLDVDSNTGAISNFQVLQTIIFRDGAGPLTGFSPEVGGPLGYAFDPEGIVVNPRTGHLLVSDEYGPSLVEINLAGQVVRRYDVPANLVPRNALTGAVNHANDAGNTAGKRTNRGLEGLAISPDGRTVFAMLQSAMLDEGGSNGVLNRIVAFDTRTGRAIAQYAYPMDTSSQGRGISALVAINETELLVLERNNRGVGVDSNLSSPSKKVYRINLTGATDVSDINLASGSYSAVIKQPTTWLDLAQASTLMHPTLAPLGGRSPEKWEGLAIGPQLADGSYLVLAGTDNDYSVSQDASAVQYDVYYKPATGARIRCVIGTFSNCLNVGSDGATGAAVAADFDYNGFALIPGVLHAYRATPSDLAGLVRPGK